MIIPVIGIKYLASKKLSSLIISPRKIASVKHIAVKNPAIIGRENILNFSPLRLVTAIVAIKIIKITQERFIHKLLKMKRY
jgi:hypothetical protein